MNITISKLNKEAKRRYPYPDNMNISQSLNTSDLERSAFINGANYLYESIDVNCNYWKRRCIAAEELILLMQNHLLVPKKNEAYVIATLRVALDKLKEIIVEQD